MIKLWMAGWLRKLAQRLDGDLYLPVSPRLKATAADLLREQWESDEKAEGVAVWQDLLLHGNAYTLNGKRVPPEDVVRDTRTGRFHVHKPNLKQEPSEWYKQQFLGAHKLTEVDLGPACNCRPAGSTQRVVDGGHLPMCPRAIPGPFRPRDYQPPAEDA